MGDSVRANSVLFASGVLRVGGIVLVSAVVVGVGIVLGVGADVLMRVGEGDGLGADSHDARHIKMTNANVKRLHMASPQRLISPSAINSP